MLAAESAHESPLAMRGLPALVTAKGNAAGVQFVADSTARFSRMTAATAAQRRLPLQAAPADFPRSASEYLTVR